MTTPEAPLLEASGLRIAVDGSVALERFDLTTRGQRLALVGDVAPLISILTNVPLNAASLAHAPLQEASDLEGLATVAGGTLRLFGVDVAEGAHTALVGAAPLDPPLPEDFTLVEYVTWSARLAGLGGRAKSSALDSLVRLGLGRAAKRTIRTLSLPERRALVLAHAAVAAPRVIVAETPLADLEGAGLAFVLAAFAEASTDRASIVSLGRTTPGTSEGQLAAHATDIAFVSRGELVLAGQPSELAKSARLVGLTVRSNAEALAKELSERGIQLRGGPLRFSAALPEGRDTRDILRAASAARSAVVELLSLM